MGTAAELGSFSLASGVSGLGKRPRGVELTLPARAESVAEARHQVAAFADELGFSEPRVDDLRTVVSEACMNAAVHAYDKPDDEGRFDLAVAPSEDGLTITVNDQGAGIRPRPAFTSPSARLGLLLIAALSSSVEIASGRERGTRLRIAFGHDRP